uniref:Regulator n=1 Tax=Syphacia muris TaxID=451379 RepID=A0A0N5ANA7_9BILA
MNIDYTEIDEHIEENPEWVYEYCQQKLKTSDSVLNEPEFLWRLAKACMLRANKLSRKDPNRKALISEGRTYATKAYALDEASFEALRWTTILTGAETEYLGIKEKAHQGKLFKDYLDKAIEVDPKEHVLLHLRGRFNYEVSNLSWLERKICNTLFSTLPNPSIDDALSDFLEAEKNNQKTWAENQLFVARCYLAKKQKQLAKEFLDKVEASTETDDNIREALCNVQQMIAKMK